MAPVKAFIKDFFLFLCLLQCSYAYLVDFGSKECLFMNIGNNSGITGTDWKPVEVMTIKASFSFLQQKTQSLLAHLRNHVRCLAITISNIDHLLVAIRLTRAVEEHIIVYSGKTEPPKDLLNQEERPIVLLLEVTQ